MKKIAKRCAWLLAAALLAFLAGCNGNPVATPSGSGSGASAITSDTSSGAASAITSDTSSGAASAGESENSGTTAGKTPTTSAVTQGSTGSTDQQVVTSPQGEKPLLEGLDFKKKTFTIAYSNDKTPNADEKALLKKFEKQFNCRIVTTVLAYDNYLDAIAKQVLSGGYYDAFLPESTHFPALLVNGLAMSLNDVVTGKDVYDPKNVAKGGISMELSSCMRGKDGKLYAVADPLSAVTGLYFYNSQALADAGFGGAKDPYTLWKQGKWTWAAFEELAKAFATKDGYLMDTVHGLVESTGASYISRQSDTSFQVNLTKDSRVFAAFDQLQKWVNKGYFKKGEYQIFNYSSFASGKYPMMMGTTNHYSGIKKQIAEAKAPAWNGGKTSLLKVVPPPQQKEGTHNLFATGAPVCVAASKNSPDPRFAVAYLLFKSNQSNKISTDTYALTNAEQQVLNEIAAVGKVNIFYQGFRNTSTYAALECHYLETEIIKGQDITSQLNKYQSVLEGLVNSQMNSWK